MIPPLIKVGSIVLRVDDLARQTAVWAAALDSVPRDEVCDDFALLRPSRPLPTTSSWRIRTATGSA